MSDDAERQRAHFNAIAERYLSGRSHDNHLEYKAVTWEHICSKLLEYLPAGKTLAGIEAMCGDAEASRRIIALLPDMRMDAFDVSDQMISSSPQGDKSGITLFREDIFKFKAKEKYDFAMIIGGLHHIPHATQAGLNTIYAALKPGGIFLNLEPTHNNFIFSKVRERIYKKNDIFDEISERAFTLGRYNELLAGAGFKVLYQLYPGLLGYVMYYNPDAFPALNLGKPWLARLLAKSDLLLGRTPIGTFFSFATWTIARKG